MWSMIATWAFSLQCVEKGADILTSGGRAMDAAEQGIHLVETDPTVDCVGRGGYLNADGEPEMYVDICDSKGWATSDGVYLWTSAGEPTTAEFSAGKAKVELKAAQLVEGDAAKIEELAEELMHTLRKE